MSKLLPFVSVLMPVRNEAAFILQSLGAVLEQDYPPDRFEIIVADGLSTDNTRAMLGALAVQHPNLKLIDNPAKIVSTGLNKSLACAKGDVIVRVDGHTEIAPDYVSQCVAALARTSADGVGGKMTAVGATLFGRAVAHATSSRFGIGGGRFHYSDLEEWVDTVYLGAWPRSVFERIGLFDEELVRDQDDEFSYRLRKFGGRLRLVPSLRSWYTTRSTPRGLWNQYFQYGYWKVRVLQKHPQQMQSRQFVPLMLVLALMVGFVLTLTTTWGWVLLAGVGAVYLGAALVASLMAGSRVGWRLAGVLPIVFTILHLSYGTGFLIGLFRFWNRWGDKQGKVPVTPSTHSNLD